MEILAPQKMQDFGFRPRSRKQSRTGASFILAVSSLLLVSALPLTGSPPEIARTKAAAEAGDPNAQYQYGKSLYLKDQDEKIAWIRRSAEQGHPLAQYELGQYHLRFRSGKDGLKNRRLAILWWSRSAVQGVSNAQAAVSRAYISELTIPKNEIAAYVWMSLATRKSRSFPYAEVSLYNSRLNALVPKISTESIAQAEAILRDFRLEDLDGENPVEADLIFSQIKFVGIINSSGQQYAALNGTRIKSGESRTFNLDTGSVEVLCEAVDSKSVRLRIKGTTFVQTLRN